MVIIRQCLKASIYMIQPIAISIPDVQIVKVSTRLKRVPCVRSSVQATAQVELLGHIGFEKSPLHIAKGPPPVSKNLHFVDPLLVVEWFALLPTVLLPMWDNH